MNRWEMAIFDWNGTLIDDLEIVYSSVVEIFKNYGLEPPALDQYRNEIAADFMRFYRKYGIPETAAKEDLNKIRGRILRERWDDAKLREGAVFILEEIKKLGLKTGIVSGEMPEILSRRLEAFKIRRLFDSVKGGAWLGKEQTLAEMLKEFNLKPNRAIYVDDSSDGIGAAKNAGLAAIGWTKGYHSEKIIAAAKPDFFAGDMNEVLKIIKNRRP